MRRSQRILLPTLLSALCASEALAQSGPLDARSIRPAVMLLVDTSGSMERIPDDGNNPSCDDCVPNCTGDTLQDRNNKTRWALTVEALTGTIQNYQCTSEDRSSYTSDQYDYGYYLPHINFTQGISQASDGILDSFASRVKFGLMTFDGVGTTLGGETLVPYSDWFNNSAFITRATTAPGMFSYGNVGRLSFPGCITDYGINAGARGPSADAGALISVGLSDNADDVLNVNNRVQQSLLQVRPFGGTPIAAMLDDLKYYVETDPDIRRGGDPLYQCRKRIAVLITDGAPDALFRDSRFQCDSTVNGACAPNSHPTEGSTALSCHCPYEPAETIANQLIGSSDHLLEQLIVVAYNVHDQAALTTLNGIGRNGSTGPVQGATAEFPYLIQADGPNELRSRLDDLFNATQPGVTSRSVPVSASTGDLALSGNSKRFDITAGFRVGRNAAEPWSGLLFRRRVTCGGTGGTEVLDGEDFDVNEGDLFHESLNLQSAAGTRSLRTAVPTVFGAVDRSLQNRNYRPEPVFPRDALNFDDSRLPLLRDVHNDRTPNGGTFGPADLVGLPRLDEVLTDAIATPAFEDNTALNALYFGDANNDGSSGTAADRTAIVRYVDGRSRPDNTLADIYHSNPVVLLPLNNASEARFTDADSSYTDWLRRIIAPGSGNHYGADGRPGVVFVGTNDGVLHAFNLDDWHEGGVLRRGGHELWGFVPPALFGKMASMLGTHQVMFDGTPEVKDVVLQRRPDLPPIYRTVVVSALRGAPAFVALDVTYPEQPVFMWQASYPDLGDTVGNVGLTSVNVNWQGSERQQRAIAILPGGEGTQTASCPTNGRVLRDGETRSEFPASNNRNVRCWNRRGRALYVVDVATGQLLQQFGGEHFPSPLTGSVVVDGVGAAPSSAAYFFDQDGVLWRLSMLQADPSRWRVSPIYDMFADPVAPSVSSPPPDWQLGRRPQYAPSLTRDKRGNLVILAGTGDVDSPTDTAYQRVISLTEVRGPAAGDGEIAADIQLNWRIDLEANESVTGPLTVFQDAVYFGTFVSLAGANQCALGQSRIWGAHTYKTADPARPGTDPQPMLTQENASPTDLPFLSEVFDASGSNLVLGLTIKRQPICQSPTRIFNAATQQSNPVGPPGGGQFQISAVLAGSSSGGQLRGAGSAVREMSRNLQVNHKAAVSSWASMVE